MSLVQRDGVGFELIGVLLLWHGFYSHSPAHYGPDSACPPLRVHPHFMRVSYASEPLAETLSGRRVEHSIRCPATSVRTSRYPSSDDPVTPADDLRSSTPIPVD